ncbi:hypothetical protein KCP75_22350 [Salmonella enterica subsp. enterica]|nr:hypothetical protein KCP75_22350 [Salmonella enterica subsp. enterica]
MPVVSVRFNHNHTPVWLFCTLWRSVIEATRTYRLLLQACSATTKARAIHCKGRFVRYAGRTRPLTDDDIQNMPYASQYMQQRRSSTVCGARFLGKRAANGDADGARRS